MHFLSPSSKNKKIPSNEKFLYFQEMELSSSNIKKFLIFFQNKAFLIFREMQLSYILGNGNPDKISYISRNGTFLYFRKFLIFHKVTFQAYKVKTI